MNATTTTTTSNAIARPLRVQDSTAAVLTRFLRDRIKGGAKRVDLRQIVTSNEDERQGGQIDSWALEDAKSPHDLAGEIESVAHSDSTALGGVNVYALLAFDAEGRELGRRSFRVALDTSSSDLSPSEKPTMLGMRAQEMRHNEVHMQLASRTALEMIENYRVLVDDYRGEVERVRQQLVAEQCKRVEFMTLHEELLSARAQRDLEAQREARKDSAQKEVIAKLSTLWPLILHKFAGAPASVLNSGTQEMLTMLLQNLSKAEVMTMANTLPIEKRLVLMEVLSTLIPPPATDEHANAQQGTA